MNARRLGRRRELLLAWAVLAAALPLHGQPVQIRALSASLPIDPVDRIHILVPGSPGGGWDSTGRGVGGALVRSGLVRNVSFENMSGGGGGRALAHLIATARRQERTWMVASTAIVLRSLRGTVPQSFRDLTPLAAVIGDYLSFVVRHDAPFASWEDVLAALRSDTAGVKFAGGSVLGGMDHLVTALALQASGLDPLQLRYVPYDTGGKAMAALLAGETPILTTGLGEALETWRGGLVRVLAVTAPRRVPEAPEVPTLNEFGADVEFVNWRGFFGPPGLAPGRVATYVELLAGLLETREWEEVRRRNGWVVLWKPGNEFADFLETQEQEMRRLLESLTSQETP